MLAHMSSASKIEEMELENRCFALVTPELSVRGVPPDVLQHVLSQANRPNV